MTKITIFSILGWSLSGGLLGTGLSLLSVPPVGAAFVLAGIAALATTYRANGIAITLMASIVALSPAMMPNLPMTAALFIFAVIYLVACDLITRFN